MIIINQATCGEKTYIVSIGTGFVWSKQYQVAAYNETEAVDCVADHLENHQYKSLYYDSLELELIAKCSEYKSAEAFAEAHNLTCCGNHGIYIELIGIEEVI